MIVKRGDIWRVALGPAAGKRMGKSLPCVVVSPPELHDFLRTVIVVPMATSGKPAPFRIAMRFDGKAALILLDQVRAMDKSRLVSRLGAVSPATLRASLAILQQSFAM
jgi:mRNA interferase MazF